MHLALGVIPALLWWVTCDLVIDIDNFHILQPRHLFGDKRIYSYSLGLLESQISTPWKDLNQSYIRLFP